MRRDPVVGQAIPSRKLEHLDVRREKGERARQHRHARAVAANDGEADCRRRRTGRDRARQVGDDQPFGAIGDPRKRERPAGQAPRGDCANDRICASPLPLGALVKHSHLRQYAGVVFGGHVLRRPPRRSRSGFGTSISFSKSSSSAASSVSICASAKRPMIRSVSRTPRRQARNRSLRRRASSPLARSLRSSFAPTPKTRRRPGVRHIGAATNGRNQWVFDAANVLESALRLRVERFRASGQSSRSCSNAWSAATASRRALSICCFTCRPGSSIAADSRSLAT